MNKKPLTSEWKSSAKEEEDDDEKVVCLCCSLGARAWLWQKKVVCCIFTTTKQREAGRQAGKLTLQISSGFKKKKRGRRIDTNTRALSSSFSSSFGQTIVCLIKLAATIAAAATTKGCPTYNNTAQQKAVSSPQSWKKRKERRNHKRGHECALYNGRGTDVAGAPLHHQHLTRVGGNEEEEEEAEAKTERELKRRALNFAYRTVLQYSSPCGLLFCCALLYVQCVKEEGNDKTTRAPVISHSLSDVFCLRQKVKVRKIDKKSIEGFRLRSSSSCCSSSTFSFFLSVCFSQSVLYRMARRPIEKKENALPSVLWISVQNQRPKFIRLSSQTQCQM